MSTAKVPRHYASIQDRFPKVTASLEQLGVCVRQHGPLDDKTAHLVQLAAAAAIQSEGSVHSHTHRAQAAGATTDELYHAVILLTSTVGFPRVAAAISWIDDVLAG